MEPVQLETGGGVGDAELVELLTDTFVGGGFTTAELAARNMEASALRLRGDLLYVRGASGSLAGVTFLVPPSSPARRFAEPHEAELHLLAVQPKLRGAGIGRALVAATIARAQAQGYQRLLLWTQTTMRAAHALYAATGFTRRPERDFSRNGRDFLFLERAL